MQPSYERLIPLRKASHAASGNSEWRNWHGDPVKYALGAISSGLNGDCAGRSQNLVKLDMNPESSSTQPELPLPLPATARPTQAHSHAGGQAGAKPKLYNPRHPERILLYRTIAEHFETWHELASAKALGPPSLSQISEMRRFCPRKAASHTAGADRAHCSAGATAAHPSASLFWCAGPELAAQGCGGGAGDTGTTGTTGQASRGAGRASQHERGRTWSGAAGPCESTHARTRASQTFTGAVAVGGVDRLHFRGHADEAVHIEPNWDLAAQPALDFELDQRVNW